MSFLPTLRRRERGYQFRKTELSQNCLKFVSKISHAIWVLRRVCPHTFRRVLRRVCPHTFRRVGPHAFGEALEAAWRDSHAEARRGGEAELGVLKGLSPRVLRKTELSQNCLKIVSKISHAIRVLRRVCPHTFRRVCPHAFGEALEAAWRDSHAEARRGGEAELGVLKGLSPTQFLKPYMRYLLPFVLLGILLGGL